jgi:hypothetical protein
MENPMLYQINTRAYLHDLSGPLGRRATLDDVPDGLLDWLAAQGFQWAWFLGVWQTGEMGRRTALSHPDLQPQYSNILPDFTEEDVVSSPFAVQSYSVHGDFGGDAALARLRKRLGERGIKLVLDFVVNHVALDHPWISDHPEYFVQGTEEDLAREPQNYVKMQAGGRETILAYGRDPYFPGWSDTLQLNYRHAGCRKAMLSELLGIAQRCDGVRCDMAMLVQPGVFQQTWGGRAIPSDGSPPVDDAFWPWAISEVRRNHPRFLFMAEVYWDLEWDLQQAGFDYTYDKRLYDRLHAGWGHPVREHLLADPAYQDSSVRFLENHDEPRAAQAFSPEAHRAAAVVTFFTPGMRFFHEGQFEGRRVRLPMQLGRRPEEPVDQEIQDFYRRLLGCLLRPEVRNGEWRLWTPRPAWEGNPTWEQFVVFSWQGEGDRTTLAAVNYGPTQGQCYVTFDIPAFANGPVVLADLLSATSYERDGRALQTEGLYLDMPAYGAQLFEAKVSTRAGAPKQERVRSRA